MTSAIVVQYTTNFNYMEKTLLSWRTQWVILSEQEHHFTCLEWIANLIIIPIKSTSETKQQNMSSHLVSMIKNQFILLKRSHYWKSACNLITQKVHVGDLNTDGRKSPGVDVYREIRSQGHDHSLPNQWPSRWKMAASSCAVLASFPKKTCTIISFCDDISLSAVIKIFLFFVSRKLKN